MSRICSLVLLARKFTMVRTKGKGEKGEIRYDKGEEGGNIYRGTLQGAARGIRVIYELLQGIAV